MKTNIEYDDDFFQIAEVKQQIRRKKLVILKQFQEDMEI